MNGNISLLICVVLAVVSTILIISHFIQKKKIRNLTESIDKFIKDDTMTELSTSDDSLAHLQSNICELENRIIQQREYTKQEAKNNTEFISDEVYIVSFVLQFHQLAKQSVTFQFRTLANGDYHIAVINRVTERVYAGN